MNEPIHYIELLLRGSGLVVKSLYFRYLPFASGIKAYELKAYGQLFFVHLASLPDGTEIMADNAAVRLAKGQGQRQAWMGFTGQITLELSSPQQGGVEWIIVSY